MNGGATETARRRRVLMVTTTFYPDPGVGGVRMTQWARCLPSHGWTPMVLTRYYGHRATPELLATHVHPDLRLEYLNAPVDDAAAAAPGKAGLKTRLKWWIGSSAASGVFVPDAGIGFWRGVRPRVLRAVEEFKPDLLVTTGPPHSNHDIGLWLAREKGIPWVADFRDPYVLDKRFRPRFPFEWMTPRHLKYEQAIYAHASLVTHAIPIAARYWRLRAPAARGRVKILTNACAPELAAGRVEPDVTPGNRRSIRTVGNIEPAEALLLAQAVAGLVRGGMDLELRLIGPQSEALTPIAALLGDRLVASPGMRHDLALRQVAGADVLVNFLSRERSAHYGLSSKLYEYLATGKPVIEGNPTVPDLQMLRRQPDVVVLRSPSLAELEEALRRALAMESRGMSESRRTFVRDHEWRNQVRVLAGWFDEVVGATTVAAERRPRSGAGPAHDLAELRPQ